MFSSKIFGDIFNIDVVKQSMKKLEKKKKKKKKKISSSKKKALENKMTLKDSKCVKLKSKLQLKCFIFLKYVIYLGVSIMKTYLYNFDPLKPHFYTVKLGFTGVYIIFLICAQKH